MRRGRNWMVEGAFSALSLLAAGTVCAAAEAEQVSLPPAQTTVYVLTNENVVITGQMEGQAGGYLLVRLPDKILRFSPQDIRGVFTTHESAQEAKRIFQRLSEAGSNPADAKERAAEPVKKNEAAVRPEGMARPELPAKAESKAEAKPEADAEFHQALTQAMQRVGSRTPAERLAGGESMLLQAQNYLLEPQALLKPAEVLPVFQACLLAVQPKQKERAEDLLKQHMKLVGSSELTPAQRELVRSRVQKLLRIIFSATADQPARAGSGK